MLARASHLILSEFSFFSVQIISKLKMPPKRKNHSICCSSTSADEKAAGRTRDDNASGSEDNSDSAPKRARVSKKCETGHDHSSFLEILDLISVKQRQLQHHTHSSLCSHFRMMSSLNMLSISKISCRHFNREAAARAPVRYGAKTRSPSAQGRREMCVQQRSGNR